MVYVKCSSEKCAERDVKGMWAKAKAGEMKGFTGYDAPYQVPENAFVLDTEFDSLEQSVEKLSKYFGI